MYVCMYLYGISAVPCRANLAVGSATPKSPSGGRGRAQNDLAAIWMGSAPGMDNVDCGRVLSMAMGYGDNQCPPYTYTGTI
jgi:hypothetical protein